MDEKDKKQKRILVVDDNIPIHKAFYKILNRDSAHELLDEDEAVILGKKITIGRKDTAESYRVDSAYQGQEALELVRESVKNGDPYALAFIDMRMPPGWDGIETIKKIWELDPQIQMVICSAYPDPSWEDITKKLGSSNNLLILKKPFQVIEICQLASTLTKKWELVTHLQALVKKRTAELVHQTTHDLLTGLPNRLLLTDRIEQEIVYAKRFNFYIGILMLDLDKFKEVNETLGHKAGDLLLQCQAKKLRAFAHDADTVARLGDDEFVVIVASQSREVNFVELAKKYVDLFLQPCQIGEYEITVTASIGVSIYPKDGENAETLLKNADAALNHQKKLGRNGFQFYQPEFNMHMLQRSALLTSLSHAIDRKEFVLYYQPLINLKTKKIIGLEALIRWEHPTLGLISPLVFIPIAEESGHIIAIGEWILRTACSQIKAWQQLPSFSKLHIAVNISVRQFRQENFVALIRNVLADTQLDPDSLELEITESHILTNTSEVITKMVELKELGIHFAIDDFGTGYSSLSYLKHFPFDKIKIDKSFIDNIVTDTNSASIVEAIIGMTKNMGIKILAEGVESAEQVDFLFKHHSDEVQGYYFSKPLSREACMELLSKQAIVTSTS